jgi:hypothetical protein
MCVGTFFKVWMQDETILVLLLWVSWHEANSRRKRIFSDNILRYVCFLSVTNFIELIALAEI